MEARALLEMAAGAIVISETRKQQVLLGRSTHLWLVTYAAALIALTLVRMHAAWSDKFGEPGCLLKQERPATQEDRS